MVMNKINTNYTGFEVAIVGISCRVSQASNWQTFWQSLKEGKELLINLTDEEIINSGVPKEVANDKNYVKMCSKVTNKDSFDSAFFGYSPNEAALMSPQTRLFHECVWESIEDAGYTIDSLKTGISLFAGASEDINWKVYSKMANQKQLIPDFTLKHINNKDFMPTLISYKLNLKGGSVTTQTACSSSLVAIHLACRALIFGETKIAIAGGVSINTEPQKGYLYKEGGILSKDGHCKAFDKESSGTVGGEGMGAVVLKRLVDAQRDGDNIYAVIKGSAINNDGNRKVGFTAPSIEGQIECIKMAQKFAKVDPSTINYVEAHGTGTKLGDSIEIEALNAAFNFKKEKSCPIGSVKTNIGHLDAAAGVIGIIKTALSLKFGQIPPTLHYSENDKNVNFDGGPFYVNKVLMQIDRLENEPKRACVNSFGVGGTNAHVILESYKMDHEAVDVDKCRLLKISAKSEGSLNSYVNKLKVFLESEDEINMDDLSYTLQIGRKDFPFRKAFPFKDKADLLNLLASNSPEMVEFDNQNTSIVFLFPGQGSQYKNMAKELYNLETPFKDLMDNGFSLLKDISGHDYKSVLFNDDIDTNLIHETRYTQPLVFLLEYSLAKYLTMTGIEPKYMIGHSLGEYVAACISGIFSIEEALHLIFLRAELIHSLPKGEMYSVACSENKINPFLKEGVSIAAHNAPDQIVLSGNFAAMDQLKQDLASSGINYVKLNTSHAFHSQMLDPILDKFRSALESINFHKGNYDLISNLTGEFISEEEMMTADYWVNQLRSPVRFSDCIQTLVNKKEKLICIEVGAGRSLLNLMRSNGTVKLDFTAVTLINSQRNNECGVKTFLSGVGKLWMHGVKVQWENLYSGNSPYKTSLPTYAFDNYRYPTEVDAYSLIVDKMGEKKDLKRSLIDANEWFYRPIWRPSYVIHGISLKGKVNTLAFVNDERLLNSLRFHLKDNLIVVKSSNQYEKISKNEYQIDSGNYDNFIKLFTDLHKSGINIDTILQCWDFKLNDDKETLRPEYLNIYESEFNTILLLTKAFAEVFISKDLAIKYITNNTFKVLKDDIVIPQKSIAIGALKVIAVEFPNIKISAIDLNSLDDPSLKCLFDIVNTPNSEQEISIRNGEKHIKEYEHINLPFNQRDFGFKDGGIYLITGANGGIGKQLAKYLAEKFKAKLVLLGRNSDNNYLVTLKSLGSEVFMIECDITNKMDTHAGIEKAERIFGKFNGVFHTAGKGDTAGIILTRNTSDNQKVLEPKIIGAENLLVYFRNKNLDFFINFSSINTISPNIGQVAYIGSNSYLESLSLSNVVNFPLITIQFSTIKNVGMALNFIDKLNNDEKTEFLKYCISENEIIEIICNAIFLNISNLIVSKRDVNLIAKRHLSKSDSPFFINQKDQFEKTSRPELKTQYLSANRPLEQELVRVFEDFFGFDKVGINDNFFDLGGDSLKGMMFVKKIVETFEISLTVSDLFSHSTISELSNLIELRRSEQIMVDNEIII
jgi:acyl transferase domain-containing protein/acyl carrier protein